MSPLSWRGRAVLITSGPTREPLDPIRFMTNASSGRMGFALAAAARRLGARVDVVSGPTALPPPAGVSVHPVTTALQMHKKTLGLARKADVVIGAAAVSDWRFAKTSNRKIKRKPGALSLTLIPNPDIIKDVARRRRPGQVVVGFALETHDALSYARGKLKAKKLDAVVANGPSALSGERSQAVMIFKDGRSARLGPASKETLAKEILRELEPLLTILGDSR